MAYDNFTTQRLFANSKANLLCNRIYENLQVKFGKTITDTDFLLTGSVAKILQGQEPLPLKVISFTTDNQSVFDYCKSELPTLLKAQALALTNRVQMQYEGIYVEVWFNVVASRPEDGEILTEVSGFAVQTNPYIPTNIN